MSGYNSERNYPFMQKQYLNFIIITVKVTPLDAHPRSFPLPPGCQSLPTMWPRGHKSSRMFAIIWRANITEHGMQRA